ncbi:extensin-like domain-containing protein [Falsirhodobacter sp. 20TX0035]|uniref:extensin-like domain-containing protein n=1 Tax=Falsirhodobacter sp. 20TX0035 TaxID=3022019 RepID=UPI0023310807|nr:extensin family protein [Falsirhodobacter sp. 20TX0035]MDB6453821.1 extensin family protein [Falsirhodobacter sp. 20TX0035]
MRRLALAALLTAASPLWAAPEVSPRPHTRSLAPAVALDYSLRPMPRPTIVPKLVLPPSVAPAPKAATGALCGVAGLGGKPLPARRSTTTGCGIEDPVEVTSVQGVPLSLPLELDCSVAKAMNDWVRTVLQPTFEQRVRRIDVAGGYVCRGRNNVPGAKVSEHGRGRAIDVSGLTFTDGRSVTVARDWNKGRDGQLMARSYKAGCGIFGTTLGPGSDGYHEDHMHFDMPSNRRSPYCR